MSTHYFSCSIGAGTECTYSASRDVRLNLYFHIQCDLWVTLCVLVLLSHETSSHYFSCIIRPGAIPKKCAESHYAKLVFLHPVRSVGHVVHSATSGAQNVDTLLFILGWAIAVSTKGDNGHVTANIYFLHPVGSACHVVRSGAFGAQNVNALFFMFGSACCGYQKRVPGQVK
jgi:hypothetical protein